jgi:hypothetical protein
MTKNLWRKSRLHPKTVSFLKNCFIICNAGGSLCDKERLEHYAFNHRLSSFFKKFKPEVSKPLSAGVTKFQETSTSTLMLFLRLQQAVFSATLRSPSALPLPTGQLCIVKELFC